MKMKWLFYFVVLLLAWAVCACSSDDPTPTPPPDPADRTVLVYMIAANSLGSQRNDIDDLAEMTAAAKVVDLSASHWFVFHASYAQSQLLELTAEGLSVVKEYSTGYSTDPERMSEVFDDVERLGDAKSYGLVLWSHGTGWIESTAEATALEPQWFGQHSGHTMSVPTLRSALEGRDFDYIYFDCCLMSSVEVMYELRNCADIIVGSPSELPAAGMPYDQNIALLLDGSREALVAAATNTFEMYNAMAGEDRSATMAVIDTRYLDELARATAAVYDLTPLQHPLTVVTNYYGSATNRQPDFGDFGEYVNALIEHHGLSKSLSDNFNNALSRAVIYHAETPEVYGYKMYNCCGLSTRIFSNDDAFAVKGYQNLQWAADVVVHHLNNE